MPLFPDSELGDLRQPPHHLLVEQAFREMTQEIDSNGNSARLDELRKHYFEIFARYWQRILDKYIEESRVLRNWLHGKFFLN